MLRFPQRPGPSVLSLITANGISPNWAGYAAAADLDTSAIDTVSDVKGTWVVPKATGDTADTYAADWIGIDGYLTSSRSVEQIGTESEWHSDGAEYYAWWEMYDSNLQPQQVIQMTIHPGDVMTAEVRWLSGNSFQLTMTDVTTRSTFSATKALGTVAQRSSAEWIHEAPSDSDGVLPLAHTTPVTFSQCSATINGVTGPIDDPSWQSAGIDLASETSGGSFLAVIAQTSPLLASGTSFTVAAPDKTAPVTSSNVQSYYAGSATISLIATDGAGGSGVAHTYYVLNGGSQVESSTVRVAGAGSYALAYWSVDTSGNVETRHTKTFTVLNPPASNGTPSTPSTPATVRHGKSFTTFGYVIRHLSGTHPVDLRFYRYQSGRWVLRKTITASVSNILTFSKYSRSTYVPYSGKWRVRARHKVGSNYIYGGYRYFTAS
jgi:hypothetical protein